MQTRDGHKSILTSTKIIYKQSRVIYIFIYELYSFNNKILKFSGFFRGLSLPFVVYGPMNSLLFGIYGNTLNILSGNNSNTSQENSSFSDIFIAGTISGSILSIPNNPLEVIRIQLQTHGKLWFTNLFYFSNKLVSFFLLL